MEMQPIEVRRITVRTGRLVCDIAIPQEKHRRTTPRLAAFACGQFSDLPHHACVNGKGHTFSSVMEHTSTAHLLEHIAISLQVRSGNAGDESFVGTTEWTREEAGEARIELGFRDDLTALRAFGDATRFLNMAVITCLS